MPRDGAQEHRDRDRGQEGRGGHQGEVDIALALQRPDAYPHAPKEVTFLETHISWVFLAGRFAYKVKRPVRRAFLDYSSLERRRFFCEEEVRLNRRTAPKVYEGVVPVVRGNDGAIRIRGEGAIVDYAVEMHRLPAEAMLDRRLREGTIDRETFLGVVETLAAFHEGAPTGRGVDEHASPDVVAASFSKSFSEASRFMPAGFERCLRAWVERFFERERPLLERRVAEGRIREGHGDLHGANLCWTPEGIVLYDCIEFDRALRCADVAADLAFLAMDLDALGYAAWSRELVARYAERTRDRELATMVGLYRVRRACVRGMVNGLQDKCDKARAYLRLALGYTLPPTLVLTCGLPAAGKSHVARHLALPLRADVLRSDALRKEIAGLDPSDRHRGAVDEGIYAPEHTTRTYEELWDRASGRLTDGVSVIVDATFGLAKWRAYFQERAAAAGCPAFVIHVTASQEEIARRLERRATDDSEVSDAGLRVFLELERRFEPPDEIPRELLIPIDGSAPADQAVTLSLRAMAGGS